MNTESCMRIPIPITADRLSFAERRKKRDGRYDGDDKNKTWCGHEMIVTTVAIVTDGMDKMGCDGTEGIRTNRTDSILFFSFGARSRESIALVRVQGGRTGYYLPTLFPIFAFFERQVKTGFIKKKKGR